ncbi:hypothetical protein PFMALIP_01277 [Plasmodium falciparum MaliPS096_E11]|uniref:ATP-dependent RNA helicase n=2 Tax=Plasmodium falciparum TaxID=5833 RepID=A0A024WTJ9_PLAFA|nr:hypothetical protein PFMALIP_01277 [Plasmodium falciparum MaliPS096_E11]
MSNNIDDLFDVFEENEIPEIISIKDEEQQQEKKNHIIQNDNEIITSTDNSKNEDEEEKEETEKNINKQNNNINNIDKDDVNKDNVNKDNVNKDNVNKDNVGNHKKENLYKDINIENYKINVEYLIKNKKAEENIKKQIQEEIYSDIQNFDKTNKNVNKIRKLSLQENNNINNNHINGKNINNNINEDNLTGETYPNDYSIPQENNKITNKLIVEETIIENSKTINNDDVLVLEEFGGDVNCIHKCVRPQSYVHNEIKEPLIPARTYKFELDTFQKKSIECLERNESVLVSAHTSAGKTVIAEYAIALGLRDKQRVIYTSPIKALSNQKYRDLGEEFKDVGLITGDISINPEASIIVMTTEILRSMLYRGSSLTKEVKWVIFDEIHYMRDRDRGVIWEETIILLPLMVRFIFLSATIPNGIQFAEWVSSIKSQACHIVYTDYRPTPLQHYIYPTSSESVFLICDENKDFKKDNFIKAVNVIKEKMNTSEENHHQQHINKYTKKMRKTTYDIEKIVQMCHSRNYTPLIIFAFSKKECEVNATAMHKIDLTSDTEKEVIKELYENAIRILADDDRSLPQVQFILPLLLRGIGIHHGGLLPIIKEIIEIMFQESLLKVLFSTETFSMGINMPAKTVVFTSLTKFDGLEKRLITSGEYIQMAGRAGRRGLDDRGIVIIMLDTPLHWREAHKLFVGEANRLVSQFHLGYNMILNLLRIEGITPEFMIERSFIQYQMKKNLSQKILAKKKVEEHIKQIFNHLTNIHLDENNNEITKDELLTKIMYNNYEQIKNNQNLGTSSELKIKDTSSNDEVILNADKHKEIKEEFKEEYTNYSSYSTQHYNENVINKELLNYSTIFSCISNFYTMKQKLIDVGETYRYILTMKKHITPYLSLGRLLYIIQEDLRWGWCICIEGQLIEHKKANDNQKNKHNNSNNNNNNNHSGDHNNLKQAKSEQETLFVECLVPCNHNMKRKLTINDDDDDNINHNNNNYGEEYQPASDRSKARWKVISFNIKCVYQLSAVVLSIDKPFDKKNEEQIENIKTKYNTMVTCLKGEKNIPVINPNQMGIKNETFISIVKNLKFHENIINKNKLLNNKNLNKYYQMYSKYVALQCEKNILESNIEKCRFIVLKKELKNMLVLLESLNYIEVSYNLENLKNEKDIKTIENSITEHIKNERIMNIKNETYKNNHEEKNYVVTMKGQIASAILSVDELVISELFFSNFFSKYNYDYICAFLSCFVYDESTSKEITINDPILVEGYQQIIKTANHVATKMNECGMNINLKDYIDKFKSAIMPIALLWARGHSFVEILSDSQIYEGSIIRTLRRLDELIRQMICAFRGINNDSMCETLTLATNKLRRGIPFSPSLYL